DFSFALHDRERAKLVTKARAADAGAARGIESSAVGLTFDLASRVEEPSVPEIDGLRSVRADVDPGADPAVGRAIRKSFFGVRPGGLERKPDGRAGREIRRGAQAPQAPFHGTSRPPARKFAARAMMKSRSESRFRYERACSGIASVRDSSTAFRSARRQTVRQKWSAAPGRDPPGRMKLRIGGSSPVKRSISASSRVTSSVSMRGT